MQYYLSNKNIHLATSIFLVVAHFLAFLLSTPPNATLLTGMFYGIVFLLSYQIWNKDYRLSRWLILFLYLSLLFGNFGVLRWSFVFGLWAIFFLLLLSYLLVFVNLWMQGKALWMAWKSNPENFTIDEEE